MRLLNQELYLFEHENSDKYKKMLVLTPCVFVNVLRPCSRSDSFEAGSGSSKVFPIELIVGGTLSNLGISEASCLSTGKSDGIFTFMFGSLDI